MILYFFGLVRKHVKKSLQIEGTTESQKNWECNYNHGNISCEDFFNEIKQIREKLRLYFDK